MNMGEVLTIRFRKEDMAFIEKRAREGSTGKSAVLRELFKFGKIFLAIRSYGEGKVSIGKAAELAGMPLSGFMDLLSELKIPTTVSLEDVLEGYEHLKSAFRS